VGILFFLAGLGLGLLAMYGYNRQRSTGNAADDSTPLVTTTPEDIAPSDEVAAAAVTETARDRLFRLKREIEAQDDSIQHPQDLLAIDNFRQGVELLASDAFTAAEVVEHLGSGGYVLPSMTALALPRRGDVQPESAVTATTHFGGYPLRFLLDYLQSRPDAATLPLLLRHARAWWWESTGVRQRLREYFDWAQAHHAGTGTVELEELEDDTLTEQRDTLSRFQLPLLQPYLEQIDATLSSRRERRVLSGFGRVMTAAKTRTTFRHTQSESRIQRLHEKLVGERATSMLINGEHGVGKTVLIEQLSQRLQEQGWLIFEASAAEILAGQRYIGELEARAREMLGVLNRPRALWRVPDFFDLLHKGAHSQDPRGILDLVLPAIERGELRVVGEITPRQLAQLLVARPALKHHFEILTLPATEGGELDELARQWTEEAESRHGAAVADARLLDEAKRLATQYFPEQHEPGRLLRLLDEALQTAVSAQPARLPLDREAIIAAISARSGLPLDVVDDRQSLDLATLREFFRQRVIGQDEAVDCLVDRIAMLKAGLVDSGRPIGVFLFAGPTGTGKTEMAKALGELLFGSSDRLLRLDMSEYQTEDAAWRLLDDGGANGSRSFTARIREQPFSVVLLDEFEKAHPKVWDLFLQVFDDGRLSDRSGHTADFRHSIIILTSNVGSTIQRNAGPGFTTSAGGYSRGMVEKALHETFRREFLNRLDRIVLFKPLDRSLMRGILHKELRRALERRGLRNRDWAVEWEPSAIEFLLDRGFTPDLGARPLRRAIEHHLLAPLARTIVEHRAPQGDQFLFVRSAGAELEVEFIDPDSPSAASTAPVRDGAAPDLRAMVHAAAADPAALAGLGGHIEQLRERLAAHEWNRAREDDFTAMAEADFWSTPTRFEVLDRIERRDRIESALDTASRLHERLVRDGGNTDFVSRQAQLQWLLELAIDAVHARRPQDALLEITAGDADRNRTDAETRLWWQSLLGMYLAWAQRRNMRVQVLEQDAAQCRALLAVSGFGAFDLLAPETGLHVLEQEQEGAPTRRIVMHVRVAADLPGRARQLASITQEEPRVSRRYRDAPSPLVRDSTRGWRSGRFDRVMAGEFDVMPLSD
jgi:ATP-dependent Clp protease ATP-binding subunit ClpC